VEEQKENKSDKDQTEVDQKVNKKTRRRSLRLKKKDEVMEIIDLGSPEPVNKEETSSSDNKLAKGEWKFRVASKIHFILAGLASRNLKTLATITGYSFKIS
jgi:hypothetical protein